MLVQPSSLIFLVIIGIWAAYFVQYWVRRREHLATIRSVHAFSETMRVLERRAPVMMVDHGGQAPRTSALSPARATRPQVTVKRAQAHVSAPVVSASRIASAQTAAPLAPGPRAMRPGRATRGVVVLVGLAGMVVFGLLSVLSVLVWWSFIVPLAMAAVGFVWLRAGVRAEIKAQRAARGRARRAAASTAAPLARRAVTAAASRAPDVAPQPAHTEPVHAEPVYVEPVYVEALGAAPFDVSAETIAGASGAEAAGEQQPGAQQPGKQTPLVAQHEVALPELDEDDIPLTWDPRPVPRPTYTMKARAAERPAPAVGPESPAQAEHPAYDEIPERRIAGL